LRLTAAGVSDNRRAAAEKPPASALLTKDSRFASVSMIRLSSNACKFFYSLPTNHGSIKRQYALQEHRNPQAGATPMTQTIALKNGLNALLTPEEVMTSIDPGEAAKAVVRRNTEEVQGGGNFAVFEQLFADDFLDHTPQPGRTPDKDGARQLYKVLRAAFPDFHADIHWQLADGDRVTTYKTYHGTHRGEFLGVAPTGRKIQFETVDVMQVRNGQIGEHWGVANLFSLMQQLGAWPRGS
jgi:steroid delta-isomerase-like uncharacterized protein